MRNIEKSTLVPSRLFDEKTARCFLCETAHLADDEKVSWTRIPLQDAVLVYTSKSGKTPKIKTLIDAIPKCEEYNKLLISYEDGALYLVIAQGGRLLLANSYEASDFTTAEYFIFLAMKSLQLNPEVTTVNVYSSLPFEDEISLYRYFKSVEKR